MPNELGFTVLVSASWTNNNTAALLVIYIQNFPANERINNLTICRANIATPDQIDTLDYQTFLQITSFPLTFIDSGSVIIPGGGGATTNIPPDPTQTYVYSAEVVTDPTVVSDFGQATLAPAATLATIAAATKATHGKKK